jgi:hypothetical protein
LTFSLLVAAAAVVVVKMDTPTAVRGAAAGITPPRLLSPRVHTPSILPVAVELTAAITDRAALAVFLQLLAFPPLSVVAVVAVVELLLTKASTVAAAVFTAVEVRPVLVACMATQAVLEVRHGVQAVAVAVLVPTATFLPVVLAVLVWLVL